MNSAWSDFFQQKKKHEKENEEKTETQPCRRVICNNDKRRFSNAGGYAPHMDSAHTVYLSQGLTFLNL